jgi:hypothetical protein
MSRLLSGFRSLPRPIQIHSETRLGTTATTLSLYVIRTAYDVAATRSTDAAGLDAVARQLRLKCRKQRAISVADLLANTRLYLSRHLSSGTGLFRTSINPEGNIDEPAKPLASPASR